MDFHFKVHRYLLAGWGDRETSTQASLFTASGRANPSVPAAIHERFKNPAKLLAVFKSQVHSAGPSRTGCRGHFPATCRFQYSQARLFAAAPAGATFAGLFAPGSRSR